MLFSGVSETYSGGESSDSQADDAKTQAIKKINDGLTQYLQPLGVQIQVVDVTESQGKLDFTAAIDLKQSPNLQKLFTELKNFPKVLWRAAHCLKNWVFFT